MIRKLAVLILFLTVSVSFAQDYTLYKVRRKATVETVAFLNDITPEQLLLANPTLNPTAKLAPGTVVRIPVIKAAAPVSEQTTAVPAEQQTVSQQPEVTPVAAAEDDNLIRYDKNSDIIRIVALLPFEDAKLAQSMCEIYSGMVIAASDISSEIDKQVELSAYSTSDLSDSNLDRMLSDKDVIVGPVFKEKFETVAKWAKEHRIPIVSPLMSFDIPGNPYVVLMPPSPKNKELPLKEYLTRDRNIILIEHSEYQNKEQAQEFMKVAPYARKFSYSRESITPQELMSLIDPTQLNVFLVPTDHQGAIEDVLSKITAINSPVKLCDLAIVGMPSWLTLSNFSQTLLFRGNVSCVSSYYYDRHNDVMSSFFDDYINAYERIPSRFALRGYDIVDIMGRSLSDWGDSALVDMDGEEFIPLMNPYKFIRDEKTGNITNEKWMLVNFLNNYSVDIR